MIMKTERWRQIEHLYYAALERESSARAGFLEAACNGDQDLRQEVESLLAYDEQAQNFIATPPLTIAAEILASDQAPALVGSRVGHYQILSTLGRGGMGEVYLAQDVTLARKIALKILPEQFTKVTEQVRRFEREAYAVSATNHPNIITIYEIGNAEGRHFIATEFVDGVTLRQRMQAARMSIAEMFSVASQIVSALAAAHEAGIVHRDIKPENVMVRPDGLVKVLDFGLAKVEERPQVSSEVSSIPHLSTEPGVVMGTISYMSPEQVRGLKVDQRTDIFSLGVVLYEILTGRRPFEGATTSDVLAVILTKEPVPLEEQGSDAGLELSRAVMRCLAKDREERFQTIGEFAAALKAAKQQIEQQPPTMARQSPRGGATNHQRRVSLRLRGVWIASALAILMVAGLAYWKLHPNAEIEPQIRSLAVLPLENLSGDPSQEYFADGITDSLIGDLARIRALRIISRTSAMRYKSTNKSLPQIGRELQVDAVVEGTVQHDGDHVRIRVQLIHAATKRHLWSESYERDLRDVLRMQSEIARAIVRAIQIQITPAEEARLSSTRPVNRKAFDNYLQGRNHLSKFTDDHLRQAKEYFLRAIKEDPTYAPAYAGLAQCYNFFSSVMIGALPPIEARRRAEEAAGKALEFDSGLAEAHFALGYVKKYNWDWSGAEREFKRAIELNPGSAIAHSWYSRYLTSLDRANEALAEDNRAQELDPLSLITSATRGFNLRCARRYDESIEQLLRVIEIDPNHYTAHWNLGEAYAAKGQFDKAIAIYEKAVLLSGRSPGALGMVGMAYGFAGRKHEAMKVLNELLELSRRRYVTPVAIVNVYIGLGKKDQAFDWLEKAYQERSNLMAYLKVLPEMDSLRSDPRFDALLRRIGLVN